MGNIFKHACIGISDWNNQSETETMQVIKLQIWIKEIDYLEIVFLKIEPFQLQL